MKKITLQKLNDLNIDEAHSFFKKCCVSESWTEKITQKRPFKDFEDLLAKAASVWYKECNNQDYLEAFTGHPKIGDVHSLKKKFAATKDWAGEEQSKMEEAGDWVIQELAKANTQYENRYGHIFIVSASGKSASEMLSIIKKRLWNPRDWELNIAMNEQHKITVIRLAKSLEGLSNYQELKSQLTTHILDTSKGTPAWDLGVTLFEKRNDTYVPVSFGVSNKDGRIGDLLPPGKRLTLRKYKIAFDTGDYYKEENTLYPMVTIEFMVQDEGHYHIPLLISPFGYSTYRGS